MWSTAADSRAPTAEEGEAWHARCGANGTPPVTGFFCPSLFNGIRRAVLPSLFFRCRIGEEIDGETFCNLRYLLECTSTVFPRRRGRTKPERGRAVSRPCPWSGSICPSDQTPLPCERKVMPVGFGDTYEREASAVRSGPTNRNDQRQKKTAVRAPATSEITCAQTKRLGPIVSHGCCEDEPARSPSEEGRHRTSCTGESAVEGPGRVGAQETTRDHCIFDESWPTQRIFFFSIFHVRASGIHKDQFVGAAPLCIFGARTCASAL